MMIKKLIRASSLFANKGKIMNGIPFQHRQLVQQIKLKLTRLFSNNNNLMLLSKTFRMFPSYFTTSMVDKMIQSEYMGEYIQYLSASKKKRKLHDTDLQKILKTIKMERDYEPHMLQIYINYIKRTVDLTENDTLMEIFDIRNPQNWFKSSLVGDRKFIYHHGPTNSGKTYSAINQLKNLKQNQRGVYMAPLRLLAWETQQKLGKCNLVTGQQKDFQNSNLTSCTIQAVKLNQIFDVAIIDEIQMIGDSSRGWSWTTPILGLKANKIHLCGDERGLYLISQLIQIGGGTLEQKKYERLSKLNLSKKNFSLNDLRPGDCIIDFSSQKLYGLRRKINELKGTPDKPSTTAIIYGKMPPNCRKQQANKFNNGQLPYLVASDAIGMGLNLKIRRIIFINIHKMSNEGRQRLLEDHQIRQIAGRAGRGYDTGFVQCLNSEIRERVKFALRSVNISIQQGSPTDQSVQQSNTQKQSMQVFQMDQNKNDQLNQNQQHQSFVIQQSSNNYDKHLKRFLKQDQMKIKKAGIFFPITIIQRVKIKMERIQGRKLKFSETVKFISQLSKENKDLYFIQKNQQLFALSDQLEHLELPFHIHHVFSQVPTPNLNNKKLKEKIIQFAKDFKQKGQVRIPQDCLRNYKDNYRQFTKITDIRQLEEQYVLVDNYTWLWNHFELYFPENQLALAIKQLICNKMTEILDKCNGVQIQKNAMQKNRNKERVSEKQQYGANQVAHQ